MKNKLVQSVKATISSIIVALLITVLLLLAIKLFLGRKIDNIFTERNLFCAFPELCSGDKKLKRIILKVYNGQLIFDKIAEN